MLGWSHDCTASAQRSGDPAHPGPTGARRGRGDDGCCGGGGGGARALRLRPAARRQPRRDRAWRLGSHAEAPVPARSACRLRGVGRRDARARRGRRCCRARARCPLRGRQARLDDGSAARAGTCRGGGGRRVRGAALARRITPRGSLLQPAGPRDLRHPALVGELGAAERGAGPRAGSEGG
ncbi:hypothetical protein ACFPRL_04185 [Pseudoclavibacter helvolus]